MQAVYNFNVINRQQKKWLTRAATFLGALVLLWVLLYGLYHVYDIYRDRKYAAKQTVVINPQPISSGYSIDTVVSTHLFGEKKAIVEKPKPKVVPTTKLDLTIEGLLSASSEEKARAIISVKKKRGALYKVGDELKGTKVKLEEIRADGVLLNHNGNIENLAFKKKIISTNRSLVSFESQQPSNDGFPPLPSSSGNTQQNSFNGSSQASGNQLPKTNGNRRPIRRPNFKGLDEALEKMQKL
ncbi:MAG: type II secretion system protein N [Arenicella sp.]